MKIRHAAALALVGWYLMVRPPVVPLIRDNAGDSSASLSPEYRRCTSGIQGSRPPQRLKLEPVKRLRVAAIGARVVVLET